MLKIPARACSASARLCHSAMVYQRGSVRSVGTRGRLEKTVLVQFARATARHPMCSHDLTTISALHSRQRTVLCDYSFLGWRSRTIGRDVSPTLDFGRDQVSASVPFGRARAGVIPLNDSISFRGPKRQRLAKRFHQTRYGQKTPNPSSVTNQRGPGSAGKNLNPNPMSRHRKLLTIRVRP